LKKEVVVGFAPVSNQTQPIPITGAAKI